MPVYTNIKEVVSAINNVVNFYFRKVFTNRKNSIVEQEATHQCSQTNPTIFTNIFIYQMARMTIMHIQV
jgi:hypothetical protein